jgi:general secretion pathway protein K
MGAPRRERGAAILLAMLVVSLVALATANAFWRGWRDVEAERVERTRIQVSWILSGALDWARAVLRDDGQRGADHYGEPWSSPFREINLAAFLADGASGAEIGGATLTGSIVDRQALLNVTNLVDAGKLSSPDFDAFARLFEVLGLPRNQLVQLSENMIQAAEARGAEGSAADAAILPQRMEHLVWMGIPGPTVAALRPYVTVLPSRSSVNLNTAGSRVIYAVVPALTMEQVDAFVAERERRANIYAGTSRSHFRSWEQMRQFLMGDPQEAPSDVANISFASQYYDLRVRLQWGESVFDERYLLHRDGAQVTAIDRERGLSR